MTSQQATLAQEAILNDLRTLPSRFRHKQTAGGWVRHDVADAWDGRSLRALISRKRVVVSEYGYKAIDK